MDVLTLFADCIQKPPVTLPAYLSSVTFPICLSARQNEIALDESYWLCLEKSESNPHLCPRISGWYCDNLNTASVMASQAALCLLTHWRERKLYQLFCWCFSLLSLERTLAYAVLTSPNKCSQVQFQQGTSGGFVLQITISQTYGKHIFFLHYLCGLQMGNL